ncbi:MAG: hypothetical protein AMK72_01390 [Planctomycetes bacterium SM23_25]|nr:MAG: hypothetical protein AMK72_01390 [Planctomycetes bacterium SM23_25]
MQCSLAAPSAALAQGGDIVIADFEGDTFAEWAVRGEAAGKRPIHYAHEGHAQAWARCFADGRRGGIAVESSS